MALKSIYDILRLMEEYYSYLTVKGVKFNEYGFPIFKKEMFLNQWPDQVVTYDRRNSKIIASPEKTVLCHFDKDERIYPRLENVLDEIDEYRKYMGSVGSDVTVTEDMDAEWQRLIMLINQMFSMVLAVNGIKIIANLRTGGQDSIKWLSSIPKEVTCASGFLGCRNQVEKHDMTYIAKLMYMRPAKMLIYGKHDKCAEAQMELMGVDFKVFPDYHRICKGVC